MNELDHPEALCPVCGGSGEAEGKSCPECSGSGRLIFEGGSIEFEITGKKGSEVAVVFERILQARKSSSINISNSSIGLINKGIMSDINTISQNVVNLANSGHKKLAEALTEITKSVVASNMNEDVKKDVLDNIEEISKQSNLPKKERLRPGAIKSIINSIKANLTAAADLSQIWSVWGPVISKFFGT